MRLLTLILMFSGFWLASSPQESDRQAEADAERGQYLFEDRGCYQCHNYDAQGGPAGAQLAPDPIPFGSFTAYVREPTGQMPPYTPNVLSDEEVADIYAFLESLPPSPSVDSIPILTED